MPVTYKQLRSQVEADGAGDRHEAWLGQDVEGVPLLDLGYGGATLQDAGPVAYGSLTVPTSGEMVTNRPPEISTP